MTLARGGPATVQQTAIACPTATAHPIEIAFLTGTAPLTGECGDGAGAGARSAVSDGNRLSPVTHAGAAAEQVSWSPERSNLRRR